MFASIAIFSAKVVVRVGLKPYLEDFIFFRGGHFPHSAAYVVLRFLGFRFALMVRGYIFKWEIVRNAVVWCRKRETAHNFKRGFERNERKSN